MKKCIALLMAAVLLLGMVPMAGAAKFTDVKTTDWYYGYVRDLAADGIINGMTETTFAPNGTLTYGQALKLIALTAGADEQPAAGGHWAGGYLALAKKNGWLSQDVDLNTGISRLAFCQIAAKSQNLTKQPASNPFQDTADPDVLALVNAGVINGMSATTFAPNATLTRAQIAKIVWCIKNPGKKPAPPTAEEIAADNLVDKALSEKQIWVLEKEQVVYKDGTEVTTYTYDANGNILTRRSVEIDGTVATDTVTYDNYNNPLTRTEKYGDSAIHMNTYEYSYTYDANGNVLTKSTKDKYGDITTLTCAYNTSGKVITEQEMNKYGVNYTAKYSYNSEGVLLTKEITEHNGTTIISYHSNGKIASEQTIRSNGAVSNKTYDENGRMLTQKDTDYTGDTYSCECTYDTYGNVVKKISARMYVLGNSYTEIEQYTYTYDECGNMLTELYVWENSQVYYATYTYDEHNNMLTKKYEGYDGHAYTATYVWKAITIE